MKKIPYGISDFKRLKTEDYFFIDKTHYIPKLENSSNYLMFLRPRRFGKTLLIAMLETYYDIAFKDKFEAIFKDTYILNNKTKEVNSYMVLKFDFSMINIYDEKSFNNNLRLTLKNFVDKYSLDIEFENNDPISMLNNILVWVKESPLNLYVLIDEYDSFINRANEMPKRTLFIQFFTSLKAGASGNNAPIRRIFMTGVTPMTMSDITSGFNIASNISFDTQFHNMIGLNNSELDNILNSFNISDRVDKKLLKEWYGNYRFNEDITEPIYNTSMILYFIKKFIEEDKFPNEMIDINLKREYSKFKNIFYTNNKLNSNFEILQRLIGGESISIASFVQDFSTLNLYQERNLKSIMFYLGLVTIKDRRLDFNLKIPNESVKRINIDFLVNAL
jgi:hypothetical protein